MRLIPLKFLGAGRNFYLIRRNSYRPSPLMREFIKTLKSLPPEGDQL